MSQFCNRDVDVGVTPFLEVVNAQISSIIYFFNACKIIIFSFAVPCGAQNARVLGSAGQSRGVLPGSQTPRLSAARYPSSVAGHPAVTERHFLLIWFFVITTTLASACV